MHLNSLLLLLRGENNRNRRMGSFDIWSTIVVVVAIVTVIHAVVVEGVVDVAVVVIGVVVAV